MRKLYDLTNSVNHLKKIVLIVSVKLDQTEMINMLGVDAIYLNGKYYNVPIDAIITYLYERDYGVKTLHLIERDEII